MARRRRDGGNESPGGYRETLRRYAVDGARAALNRLRQEIQIIERTFPELAVAERRAGRMVATTGKRARKMSAAARKAVSARMRKYWAERRKQAAKTKK
jgi:hypothetical protein